MESIFVDLTRKRYRTSKTIDDTISIPFRTDFFHLPRHVFRRPGFLNVPLTILCLNLNHWFGFITNALEIIFEPNVQLNSPIHPAHVWIGFSTIATAEFTVSIGLIRIVVRPLSRDGAGIDSSISHELVSWEGMVWIDVPILKTPDQIHTTSIVFQHIRKMTTLIPIIVPFRSTKLSKCIGCPRIEWANKIVGTYPHVIGG